MNQVLKKSFLPSFCTSNLKVIEIIMLICKYKKYPLLIETTSNQVNQYGGYSGFTPQEFKKKIYQLIAKTGFKKNSFLLGGDHLGPLPFKKYNSYQAMQKSETLILAYLRSNYGKIHLDTAIKCKKQKKITLKENFLRFRQLVNLISKKKIKEIHLVVGTEVPLAGGGSHEIRPTKLNKIKYDYLNYSAILKNTFKGVKKNFSIVIEPGITFKNNSILIPKMKKFKPIFNYSKKNNFYFEAHSTDYQPLSSLKKLVKNNFKFLKVGPELTYQYSRALFSMEKLEKKYKFKNYSLIKENIYKEMKNNDKYWKEYYTGSKDKVKQLFFNSYLDRSRYYLQRKNILKAISRLEKNLNLIKKDVIIKKFRIKKDDLQIAKKNKFNNLNLLAYIYLKKTVQKYYEACGFKIK